MAMRTIFSKSKIAAFISSVAILPCSVLFILSCSPKNIRVQSSGKSDATQTPECAMMKEICDQALQFQKQFDAMPDNEKKDVISVLTTYIDHCEQAKQACEKSQEK